MIDGDDQIRHLLRRALEMEDHLVITDIFMPEKDGLEVLMALRREAPRLKVIAMSGGGRRWHMAPLEAARSLGAFASLSKPFELDAMLEAVERALTA